ncbi:MAG TPA: MFS transporter [Pseudomonadales bacterium]|nr:MFS transporter [Pseudomonadales bacterium]
MTSPAKGLLAGPVDALRGLYYGWYVVAALFVMLTTASGLAFYNLSVYMNALVATYGFPVGAVSTAIAVFFVSSGLAGLGAARAIQDHDPRWTIALGGVLGAVALLALGSVTELWQLYVVYALFGTGHACAALVPATTLVARWFVKKRSIALSVASTGLSLGGVMVTPASAALIASSGLEAVSPWLAAGWVLGIVPITALIVRAAPDDSDVEVPLAPGATGAAAAGAQAAATTGAPAAGAVRITPGWMREDALRSRWFLLITGAWVLLMLAQVGGISHLYNLAATRADTATGATAVSLMATCSILGRFAGGWLISRFDTRTFALVCIVWQVMSMTVLALASTSSALLLGAGLFGASVGNLLMLQPLLLAEAFGVRDYGRIFSLSQLVTTLGVASGPALLGLLYDALGGYGPSFALAACASSLALVAMLVMGPLPNADGPRQDSDLVGRTS